MECQVIWKEVADRLEGVSVGVEVGERVGEGERMGARRKFRMGVKRAVCASKNLKTIE